MYRRNIGDDLSTEAQISSDTAMEILRLLKNTYYYEMADSVDQVIRENRHLDVLGLIKWIEETQTDTAEIFLYRKGILRRIPKASQKNREEGLSYLREINSTKDEDEIKNVPAMDELIGIIEGINYDGIVNTLEVKELSAWLSNNAELLHNPKYGSFLHELREMLSDGIIDDEERDLLIKYSYSFKNDVDDVERSLNVLVGILDGIICDQEIADEEVFHLYEWISDNEHLQGVPTYDRVVETLEIILEDGIITEEEKRFFLIYTSQIVSASKEIESGLARKGEISFGKESLTRLIESILNENGGLRTHEIAALIPGTKTIEINMILHAKENKGLFAQSEDYGWHNSSSSDSAEVIETTQLSTIKEISSILPEHETNTDILSLNLSNRSYNCLKRAGIDTISQLAELSWEDLFAIRNLGALSADEIVTKLEEYANDNRETHIGTESYEELARLSKLRMEIPIEVLDLSARAFNCLKSSNYNFLNQLAGLSRNDLLEIKSMGRGTAGEIIKKINVFLDDNRALYNENIDINDAPYVRNQRKDQLRIAIRNAGFVGVGLSDITDAIKDEIPDAIVKDLLEELIGAEEILEDVNGLFHINYPSILELIEGIKNGRNRDIVRSWFNGRGLTQIAQAYGISKQRVQQIVTKGIREALFAVEEVREDRFHYVFTTYEIRKDIWKTCIKEPMYIYLYLGTRYKRGNRPIAEALEDDKVSEDIKKNIRTFIEDPKAVERGTWKEQESDEEEGIEGTIPTRFTEGDVSYVVQYYNELYESERDVQLYKDQEEFEKKAVSLKKRIARELKHKKYISDIKINDEEYELLRAYLHYAVPIVQKMSIIPDKDLFITAVVQVAIRAYKDGNFWSNFFDEIEIKQKPQYRTAVGDASYLVLKERDLIWVAPNEYVQNILLHCFISNNYADGYFDFLYAFYRIDLDRDIDRLDRNLMNELMDSICSEENEGRTFMIVKHIGQAMAANQRGAKIRIRSHLKLMDRFFWDDQYEIKTDHRIKNLLQEWVRKSERMKTDIAEYQTGRRRGKKRFSHPYISLNEETDTLSIMLPAQSIKEYDTDNISWHVYGKFEDVIPVEMTESVLGYKVLETDTSIDWDEALEEFRIELKVDDTEEIIKKFKIQGDSVRLFDDNGYPVNSNNIKVGDVIAVSKKDAVIDSNALYDKRIIGGMLVSYFQFEYEDIVRLPDGHAVIVGIKEITNSIAGKGRIEGARCVIDDTEYALYGKIPYLVLRMKAERAKGTSIAINGKRHRLTDYEYKEFSLDDRSDDTGYYMNLADMIVEDADDLYRIEVDIPNTKKRVWSFAYIRNFEVKFEEAPYVFEPRGTASFPEHINIKWIKDGCIKGKDINAFKFEVKSVNRTLDLITFAGDKEVHVSVPVPAFFMKNADGEWNSEKPAPIWHSELPDIIDLSLPYHKVTLYMEEDVSDDGDTEVREVEYRRNIGDNHIECDVTKFKSYLAGDEPIKQMGMKFGNVDEVLLDIMIHSSVVTCQIIGDFNEQNLIISTLIQGKSQYYVDVMQDNAIIAEKVPVIDGRATIPWEIENARYDVEIFEMEEDESGFGEEEYYSLGKYNQQLLNPYDMSKRSFRIVRIEKREDSAEILPLGNTYYVERLEKTDEKDTYEGIMVVEKNLGEVVAALPVHVIFEDIENPTFVWISFLDEYNEEMDFLYDTRRRGILQEENSNISKLACYRRYTMLDSYDDVFHIEFCERDERDYDDADEQIVFPEETNLFRFKSGGSKHKKRTKPISDITWSKTAYVCLLRTGDTTLEQLSDRTRNEFIRVSGAPEDVTDYIERIMEFYGYQFAEKSKSQKALPKGAVALPKTHGIKVSDIKWRNARARACLDRAGITTLDRLASMSKEEFSELKSANENVIARVEEVMQEYGYHFREN